MGSSVDAGVAGTEETPSISWGNHGFPCHWDSVATDGGRTSVGSREVVFD